MKPSLTKHTGWWGSLGGVQKPPTLLHVLLNISFIVKIETPSENDLETLLAELSTPLIVDWKNVAVPTKSTSENAVGEMRRPLNGS